MSNPESKSSFFESVHRAASETSRRHLSALSGLNRMKGDLITWYGGGTDIARLAKSPAVLLGSIAIGAAIGTNMAIHRVYSSLSSITKSSK